MCAHLGTCPVCKVIIAVVTHEAIKKKATMNAAAGRKLRRKIGWVIGARIFVARLCVRPADLLCSDYQDDRAHGVELRVVRQIPTPGDALRKASNVPIFGHILVEVLVID